MSLRLTVLGSAGSHTGVGRACSGYLVASGDTHLLVDAGNGSTANLQRLLPLTALDAVVISHRHVDHCIDLIGCYYNLRFDPSFDGQVPLYAAAGVRDALTAVMSNDSTLEFDLMFRHQQVGHGDEVTIGGMQLRFARSRHPVPTVSTRIEADGRTLVYSGDSAGGEDLVRIAADADLFLCEASWTGDASDYVPDIHLTATDAGRIARQAGVGRLVLTHITGAVDRNLAREEAAAAFEGPVHLAEDLDSYQV